MGTSRTITSHGGATSAWAIDVPQGRLGSNEVTANQGTFTAETDLTSLSVTVTVVAGRKLRITGEVHASSTVAADEIGFFIKEGATYLAKSGQSPPVANRNVLFHREKVVSPSAGSHTYKLAMSRLSGTGDITMVAAAGNNGSPAFILVEDIGT